MKIKPLYPVLIKKMNYDICESSIFMVVILLLPAIVWYIMKQKKAQASLQVSSTFAFDKLPTTYKAYLRHLRFILRLGVVACVIVALARPQSTDKWENQTTEGVDIVVALDISTSMLARDFKPNRIDAAKDVAAQFITGRTHDNIGVGNICRRKFYNDVR